MTRTEKFIDVVEKASAVVTVLGLVMGFIARFKKSELAE
jgi:hypothetical protein